MESGVSVANPSHSYRYHYHLLIMKSLQHLNVIIHQGGVSEIIHIPKLTLKMSNLVRK
jgi:hypothetical protein